MAKLKERLRADLNDAMRARDQVRMRTLRMALTSITNEEVSGAAARELTDDEVLRVLIREAKKRREAAEASGAAGRTDQAAAQRLGRSLQPSQIFRHVANGMAVEMTPAEATLRSQ